MTRPIVVFHRCEWSLLSWHWRLRACTIVYLISQHLICCTRDLSINPWSIYHHLGAPLVTTLLFRLSTSLFAMYIITVQAQGSELVGTCSGAGYTSKGQNCNFGVLY
ncbi:hypothetical protein ACJX0J_030114, partial [Zea mays]